MNANRNQKIGWGFKQLIERKQGLFRMHMMGKRVNHACRTVICPDPNIGTDEIGLPEVFATKLSYQVPVTPWNVTELREMVINGPNVHPGSVMVENEFGQNTVLDENYRSHREGIAKTIDTQLRGCSGQRKTKDCLQASQEWRFHVAEPTARPPQVWHPGTHGQGPQGEEGDDEAALQ